MWVVAQTKSRHEKFAICELERHGHSVYCPLARITKRHAGKVWQDVEPLFARYLFIVDSNQSAAVRRIRGVTSVIMQGNRFARVPDAVIESIRAREVLGAVPLDIRAPDRFSVNDRVKITKGTLQGLDAVYKARSGEARALVLVKFLGSMRPVPVSIDDLQAA